SACPRKLRSERLALVQRGPSADSEDAVHFRGWLAALAHARIARRSSRLRASNPGGGQSRGYATARGGSARYGFAVNEEAVVEHNAQGEDPQRPERKGTADGQQGADGAEAGCGNADEPP